MKESIPVSELLLAQLSTLTEEPRGVEGWGGDEGARVTSGRKRIHTS